MNIRKEIVDKIAGHYSQEEIIILESQLPRHPSSILSYAAIIPKRWIRAYGREIRIFDGNSVHNFEMNPWEALKQFRNKKKCWLFGYFGYDLKNFTENLSSQNSSLADLPDLFFMEPEILLSINNDMIRVEKGYPDLQSIKKNLLHSDYAEVDFLSQISRNEYFGKVHEIKNKIADGDFYELNYSYPLTGRWQGNSYTLYQKMREINPVPFGAFLRMNEGAVCCISPERFLKKTGSKIISEPIKGTAERSEDPETDELRKLELLNEKNRAENLMIVDLVRHDLSKIAKTGSVKVNHLYDVQTFDTVHQLISTIEAEVKENTDAVDVIKECFPMGSMTGAPKIEVMKTIDKLENYKRGIYSGAIGYFSPDDDFDFNVVIRTAILQGDKLIYPVGGAITSDSDPEMEWHETKIKSRSLTDALSKDVAFTK